MAQLINYGREMLRINTQKNAIEYSTNDGRLAIQVLLLEFSMIYSNLEKSF